jgi:hypothetical protein
VQSEWRTEASARATLCASSDPAVMMDRDTITRTGARTPGVERLKPLERRCPSAPSPLDLERGYDEESGEHEGRRQTTRRGDPV